MKPVLAKRIMAMALALILAMLTVACSDGEDSSVSSSAVFSTAPASQPVDSGQQPLPLAVDINALTGEVRPEGMLEGQRPVAIMVSNNQRSLPQRGLAGADVIYEALTEGGITRLMAMYADYRTVPQVGAVRSTRDVFVQLAVPSDAILVHIGSSVYAENLLNVLAYQDIDGYYVGTTSFYFDTARSLPKPGGKLNEYCWFTDAGLIWNGMEYLDIAPTGPVPALFHFADSAAPKADAAYAISVTYSPVSVAGFVYDDTTGLYTNTIFGGVHADEDGTPLTFTNVILLSCPVTLKPDGQCTEVDLRGGEGVYFTSGGVQEINWRKGGPTDELRLYDSAGKELPVQPGKSYVGLVPDDVPDAVVYRSKAQVEADAASAAAAVPVEA